MKWWKIVGLAGIAGVAGTGVLIARSERTRRAYTPDEVRSRLHARAAEAESSQSQEHSDRTDGD
ncbi:MAG: hypothetical protein ACRDRM_13065 [Pseudonocardiaceae bacterium]